MNCNDSRDYSARESCGGAFPGVTAESWGRPGVAGVCGTPQPRSVAVSLRRGTGVAGYRKPLPSPAFMIRPKRIGLHPLSRSDRPVAGPGGRAVERLPAGEAGVLLVPVRDGGLAEPPAEADLAAVSKAGEVAETVRALQIDAELVQFLDIRRQLRLLGVELGAALGGLLGIRVVGGPAPILLDRREPPLSSLTTWNCLTMSPTIALTSGSALFASSTLKNFGFASTGFGGGMSVVL